ncbi:MAG: response regulator transcription factor [Micrococcales bacterium]|nr:response regulator transcription factor [Micrococcales bacterium]
MRILVVEDEEVMAGVIATGLRRAGHVVDVALDGGDALDHTELVDYDVILLDRDLPVLHGDLVCRQLVEEGYPGRILMLTAAVGVDDRVEGLGLGADDYLPKPFAFRELMARVEALGRRAVPATPQVAIVRDLRLDRTRREVERAGRPIALTPKEFGVLDELIRADGAWLSAERLLTRVWDENADPFSQAVKITIARLRAKLGEPDLIETERGVGYRLVGVAPGPGSPAPTSSNATRPTASEPPPGAP